MLRVLSKFNPLLGNTLPLLGNTLPLSMNTLPLLNKPVSYCFTTFGPHFILESCEHAEMFTMIIRSRNFAEMAAIFESNSGMYNPYHVLSACQQIENHRYPTQEWHQFAKLAFRLASTAGRSHMIAMAGLLIMMGNLKVEDERVWTTALKRLDEENLYRYINLQQLVGLFQAMTNHGRYIGHNAFRKIQKTIIQQQKYYMQFPLLLGAIKQTADKLENLPFRPIKSSTEQIGDYSKLIE